jgi:hypothetical protein
LGDEGQHLINAETKFMKIKRSNEELITLIEKSLLDTVMTTRLNPPFFSIHYDHVTKTGRPAEDTPAQRNAGTMLNSGVRFHSMSG